MAPPKKPKDEEEEWEYEYSTTETESFYIPVDVSNVPELQTPSFTNAQSQRLGHPWLLKTKLRAFYANRKEAEGAAAAQANSAGVPDGERDGDEAPAPMGEIQAVGLHTENPLMMYNGQLLSCQWVSALGTDLMFAKPEAVNERDNDVEKEAEKEVEGGESDAEVDVRNVDMEVEKEVEGGGLRAEAEVRNVEKSGDRGDEKGDDKPLRSLPEVDLIAMSSARLVARVGRLRPKDELFERTDEGKQATGQSAPGQTQNAQTDTTMTGIEEQVTRPTTSSFLAKLNAVKAKRGEKSRLVLSGTADGSRLVTEEVERERQPSNPPGEIEDATMSGT